MNRRQLIKNTAAVGIGSLISLPTLAQIFEKQYTHSNKDLVANAQKNIQDLRTKEVRILLIDKEGSPVKNKKVRIEQKKHHFLFGNNYLKSEDENSFKLREREEVFLELFNAVTIMCYWTEKTWKQVEKTEHWQGEQNLKRFKETVNWAKYNQITAKGHPLFWSIPKAIPDWMQQYDYPTQLKFLEVRVRNLVASYKGKVDMWDVVNEFLWEPTLKNTTKRTWPFIETTEELVETIAPIMKWAREENPSATLLLNEYGVEQDFNKNTLYAQDGKTIVDYKLQRKRYLELVKRLGEKGYAPDAIGLQAHMGDWQMPEQQVAFYDEMASAGIPLHITEFWANLNQFKKEGKVMVAENGDFITKEIKSNQKLEYTNEELAQMQADYAANYLTCAFGHKSVDAFFFWGFKNFAIDFDENGFIKQKRPVYQKVKELIKEKWWTKKELTTNSNGEVSLNAFFGEHELFYSPANQVNIQHAVPFQVVNNYSKDVSKIVLKAWHL